MTRSENHSKRPAKGAACVAWGQSTCHAKKTARLTITPTTTAVMPVRGAVKNQPIWVSGPAQPKLKNKAPSTRPQVPTPTRQ
ncbi:hypothetical protein THSYN_06920 [Candidatus Thiodictyon syntrophicum]|jgi:hypothetical protein|uniref:Uncharacterized protein n=1 Tax=Candidatus Thiodictyon syntrophicum TaxID=1166950 RepID=A0A2K8U5N4_9GAMM|nr:hypothetical protein THSYN_06920 [Candidatus Thiodictyon syntrophicum]